MDSNFILFDKYHDYMLMCSMVVVLVSFVLWRNSFFLSQSIRNITQSLRGEQRSNSTPQSSTSESQAQQQQQPFSDQVAQTEPFDETFTGTDVSNVNIIQSENTYHRQYKKSRIHTVYDLKKYFYPADVASQKRIIFIHNGRSMIDTASLNGYPAFNDSNEFPPTIHCIIKAPLTSDQISNDPNTDSDSSDLTWMTTKSLYTLTGLFLLLLWTLQFTKPKFFDVFSTILLFLFTFCWGVSFYSSLKASPIIQNSHINHGYRNQAM